MIFMSFDSQWGCLKIAKIIPKENNNWGVYLPLKDTLNRYIDEVQEDHVEMALHGYAKPLLDCGLRSSDGCLSLLDHPKICFESKDCASYKSNLCTLKNKKRKTIPECFVLNDDPLMKNIISAWIDGYIILRVK